MWSVKTKLIPLIIGATGSTSQSFRKYLRSIQGKHEVREIQQSAVLGTAHVLQKVLMEKCKILSWQRALHAWIINCNYIIAATLLLLFKLCDCKHYILYIKLITNNKYYYYAGSK
jgi:hypothetical protein